MADILIRGMEMPNNCAECPVLSQWDDCGINHKWKFADEFDKTKDRLPSCPLLSLPEGHGRLIDANELELDLVRHNGAIGFELIGNAPTIIPAEGGGEV